VEIRYDKTQETHRYFGAVQARYEVDQAFRVGGKVVSRKVDVGQKVRQGDVIAVLDETDYKLAVQAAQQQVPRQKRRRSRRVGSQAARGVEERRLGQSF
jgi:multidrug efflux pump subunit AcrA (membrane-fusion protein)